MAKHTFSDDDIERYLSKIIVSPKLEAFRPPVIGGTCPPHIKIKGARGGRGAGAKSWSVVSLIVQIAEAKYIRVVCLREIQKTISESVYRLIQDTVVRLGFSGWTFTDEKITAPNGSYFIFRGLKDLTASRNIKGLEGFDIFFIEEASSISMDSLIFLLPTIVRNNEAELWFCYNQETEFDPITLKIWNENRPDALCIELEPGKTDNPWWNAGLEQEMALDFKFDADLAEHIWYGLPRKQGQKSIMSRVDIIAATRREVIVLDDDDEQVGVDVARFGDDKTEIWYRKGLKVITQKTLTHADTQEVARTAWDIARRNYCVAIYVDDTGVGGGVTDKLRDLGANVHPINFGSAPDDKEKYTTVADELWFEFPIHDVQIPSDPQLIQELSSRQYGYDKNNRRKIEAKKEFKKRVGRSPDKSDALLLAFYQDHVMEISSDLSKRLAARMQE